MEKAPSALPLRSLFDLGNQCQPLFRHNPNDTGGPDALNDQFCFCVVAATNDATYVVAALCKSGISLGVPAGEINSVSPETTVRIVRDVTPNFASREMEFGHMQSPSALSLPHKKRI